MNIQKVEVTLPRDSYEIWIGPDLLDEAARWMREQRRPMTAVVSDETVWALHGRGLEEALTRADISYGVIIVPPGEDSKSLAILERVYRELAGLALGRDGLVIAFGGGVVGDLAGFAAATWMRGVDYIQIPTTLLAQVDSSVGGKTAVNLAVGKNLVGAFYQPRLVVADTGLLHTLPLRETRCGLAEMVKYGAIFSEELFEKFSRPIPAESLPELIRTCCRLKSRAVQQDERDKGGRMLLNFGHTFGHAIEKLGGYSTYNHGEAVAIGMVLAARMGETEGVTPAGSSQRLRRALAAQGLPDRCPYQPDEMTGAMALDKKGRGGGLDLVMLRNIGQAATMWHSLDQIKGLLAEVL